MMSVLLGMTTMALSITSPVFNHEGEIPRQYSCQGKDLSPPLEWSDVPKEAKSLVLIVDDPDAPDPKAPKMTYVHWVLYNIPVSATGLREDIPATELPTGTLQGKNDWVRLGYGGPCPPIGRHRYFFKLYALDRVLPEKQNLTKAQLIVLMQGSILQEAQLIGTYEKSK